MPLTLLAATSGSTTLQATDNTTQTLTLPTGTGTILSSGAPQSGGVIQVVNVANNTGASTTSTSFVITPLTATITPKFSTSKILVIVDLVGCKKDASNSYLQAQIVRNSTAIVNFELEGGYTNSSTSNTFGGTGCNYLDSPVTTSATSYTVYIRNGSGGGGTISISNSSGNSTITLMEIAA